MDDISKLEKLNEEMKQSNYDALLEHSACVAELNIMETVNVKEKDFKTYFLPIFKKEIELNEENINRFINNIYILTNSYNKPIQIIDDRNGKPLFRLPPLALDVKDNDLLKNINYTNLINMYNVMNDSGNTTMANSKLAGLTNALGEIVQPDDQMISSYNEDIIFMYNRYNIKYQKDNNGNTITNTIIPEEDEIEYDYD
jgi:hypothetical protein